MAKEETYEFADEPEHDPIEAIQDVTQAEPDYDNINDERKINRLAPVEHEPARLSEWMERIKMYHEDGVVRCTIELWDELIGRVKRLEG